MDEWDDFLKGPAQAQDEWAPFLGDLDGPSKASLGPLGSPRTPDLDKGSPTPPDKEIVAPGASQRPYKPTKADLESGPYFGYPNRAEWVKAGRPYPEDTTPETQFRRAEMEKARTERETKARQHWADRPDGPETLTSDVIRGMDKVLGRPETIPGMAEGPSPEARARQGGLMAEFVRRSPTPFKSDQDNDVLAYMAAVAGGVGDLILDPWTWVGAAPGAKAAGKVAAGAAAAAKAVPPTVHGLATGSDVGRYIARGTKGLEGEMVAEAVMDWQSARHALNLKANSEGAKVAKGFADLKQKEGLYRALYEHDHYGTPIPPELKEGATEALSVLRRSQSEMDDLREALRGRIHSDPVLNEYPFWRPRMFEEPIREAAEKGAKGRGKVPGMLAKHEREDAYNLMIHGMEPEEVNKIILGAPAQKPMFGRPAKAATPGMAPEVRPYQPAAPTMSKGLVEKVGGGTFVKFPNTREGSVGFDELAAIVEDLRATKPERGIKITRTEPIPASGLIENAEGEITRFLTPITDMPTIMSRGWRTVLQDEANDALFRKITQALDDDGTAVAVFVPEKWVGPGQRLLPDVPEGYVLMEQVDPKRNWGVLMRDVQDGLKEGEKIKGAWAVKESTARYISAMDEHSSGLGIFLNDLADTIATNQISGTATAVMNTVQNKIGIDSINGTSWFTKEGRRIQRTAGRLSREHLETGILPKEIEPLAPYLSDPAQELLGAAEKAEVLGFEDKVQAIFDAYDTPGARPGRTLGELLTASPFAKSKAVTAAGGALVGGVTEGFRDDDSFLEGAARGAIIGAGGAVAARPLAKGVLNWFRHSDRRTTIAAFLKHKETAIAKGLTEEAAIAEALTKTRDLTQAGQWGRLGGVGEALAASPGGMVPSQTTGRGLQKLFLNRFLKWPEVQTRILYNAMTKYGLQEQMGAAATMGAYAAFRLGGRRAVVGSGLLTEEEAQRAESLNPGAILYPGFDSKKGQPTATLLNGRAFSGTPLETSELTMRGLANKVLGPASQSVMEVMGGEDAISTFSGAPLRKTDIDTATPESPGEALVRSNAARYASPYALGGRIVEGVRSGIESAVRGDKAAPSPEQIALTPVMGRVKTVDPEADLKSLSGAFHKEANDISDRYFSSRNKTARTLGVPVLDAARSAQSLREEAELVADKAEEYLKKGLPEGELFKHLRKPKRHEMQRDALVRKILIERGVIKAPKPAIPGMGG